MLEVPPSLFNQIADRRETVEENLLHTSIQLLGRYTCVSIVYFEITPEMPDDADWRNKTRRLLSGESVTNQGWVRSDSVAPYQADGLLLRSQAEIHLYRALKGRGISFAPLPVFIRGGELYRRVTPSSATPMISWDPTDDRGTSRATGRFTYEKDVTDTTGERWLGECRIIT